MEITVTTEHDTVTAVLKDGYTNVTNIIVNGNDIMADQECSDGCSEPSYDILSLDSIIEFADNADMKQLELIANGLKMNEELACAGLEESYGAQLGRVIRDRMAGENIKDNVAYNAMMWTAAGVDARMAGCSLPAMSNTGSGNQGIVCTMPVFGASKAIGASWENTVRSAAVSCLTAIYIKYRIGALSTVCGCAVAGTGSSCGIVYLYGGRKKEMIDVLKNMFGNVAGIICDGAKASCSLKAATCINAACIAAELAMNGFGLEATNGIVGKGEEDSIDYFVRTSREGLSAMDHVIIDIIMNK